MWHAGHHIRGTHRGGLLRESPLFVWTESVNFGVAGSTFSVHLALRLCSQAAGILPSEYIAMRVSTNVNRAVFLVAIFGLAGTQFGDF